MGRLQTNSRSRRNQKRKKFKEQRYINAKLLIFVLLLVVVTRPLPRDGGIVEDHGPPGPGPEVVERQRVT